MCKSSTLAFVLIFAFLFKLEQPRLKLIAIIVIITAGVVLMVSDETDFVVVGYVKFGLVGSGQSALASHRRYLLDSLKSCLVLY